MRATRFLIFLVLLIPGVRSVSGTPYSGSGNTGNTILSPSQTDTARFNSLIRKGLKFTSKPELLSKVKACIDTLTTICEKQKIETPPPLHLLKAEYLFANSNYIKSYEEGIISLEKARKLTDNEAMVKALLFMAKYYQRTGMFKESLDFCNESIVFSKHFEMKGYSILGYLGQSQVYLAINDIKEYQKALGSMIDAAISANNLFYVEEGYFSLGSSYLELDRNFRKADSILKKCTDISLITKDTIYTSRSLSNRGWNFYLNKSYDSSLYYYNKSLKYSIPGKRYGSSANSFGNLGTIYRDLGNRDMALKNYTRAIDNGKKIDDWYNLAWVYKDMSDMYLNAKDTSNAFICYVNYKQYNDSNIIKKGTKGLSDARVRYEAETHSKEIQLLSLKLKNQRILIYGITGFLLLVLAIVMLLLSRARIKAGRRISEMNRKISEITQANLRQQMNPHFIFNTLNSIQYYMYQHDKLATNIYLTKFSSLMRKVLENSQHTSVALREELDALTLYLELESLRFKDKFSYEIKVDEDIDTLLYRVPTMLIQPYVENSICHGLMPKEGKGSIKIDLRLKEDQIVCTIEDNGIGREAAQERKKQRTENHNSLGTQIVSSRLDLVSALYGTSLKTIYTDLKNENGEPEGTRVELQIPLMT